MISYDFIGDNNILKLNNDGREVFIDLADFSVYKEDDFEDKEDFRQSVKDLYGSYGIGEEFDME